MKRNMKSFIRTLTVILLTAFAASCFMGCGGTDPQKTDAEKAQSIYEKHREAFDTLKEFMLTQEDGCFINIDTESDRDNLLNGIAELYTAPGVSVRITDEKVTNACRELLSVSDDDFSVGRNGNTIGFNLWAKYDVYGGIAYVTDGSEPDVQFLTEYYAFGEENWFLTISDYALYRKQHS